MYINKYIIYILCVCVYFIYIFMYVYLYAHLLRCILLWYMTIENDDIIKPIASATLLSMTN